MGNDLPPGDPRDRVSGILAAVLILVLLGQTVAFAGLKGVVYDEAIDIAAGYAYLRTGTYRLCPEHPALATAIAAAPLLLLSLEDPRDDPDFRADQRWRFAFKTLHENRAPRASILFLGRLSSILLAGVLGWLLYRWARREFGRAGAVASLFLLATSPTFIAHSALATGDSLLAVAVFISFLTLRRCLEEITWGRIAVAGACLGAALAIKMTAIILFPLGLILAASTPATVPSGRMKAWLERLPPRARDPAARMGCLLLVLVGALLAMQIVYLGRVLADPQGVPPYLHDPGTVGPQGGVRGGLLAGLGWVLPDEYVYGLREMLHSSGKGWPHFLLGEIRTRAEAWSYPLVGLLKTRELVLLGLAVAVLGWRLLALRWTLLLHLLAPPVLLLIILGTGSGYHGVRILLPGCPFIFLIVGGAAGTWLAKIPLARALIVPGALAALLPCLLAFPHYLAYQNSLSGSKEDDFRRLVDSDLDWGQDLPALAKEIRRLGNPPVYLRYFGTDDPRGRGFDFRLLSGCDPVQGTVAISATHLQGVYLEDPRCHRWLLDLQPVGRAGRSILIYRVP